MADVARVNTLLEQLNGELGDVTPYKLAVSNPQEILPLEKNAHFMTKRTFDQLVSNIAKDGNLSSLPFCWKRDDGRFVCLSGNHRVKGAVEAKLPLIMFLYTDRQLSAAERIAIQLSHNAIVGQDNPTILTELWRSVDDLGLKVYSGLDDKYLKSLEVVKAQQLGDANLQFDEMTMLFLSPEIDRIKDVLGRLGSINKPRLAAQYSDFDRFFDALLKLKEAKGILNTATAFGVMIEIVEDYLAKNDHHKETAMSESETEHNADEHGLP